jgi:hypothetical protein
MGVRSTKEKEEEEKVFTFVCFVCLGLWRKVTSGLVSGWRKRERFSPSCHHPTKEQRHEEDTTFFFLQSICLFVCLCLF